MKSATEVSMAWRPVWARQVSVYRLDPCSHKSSWPSSITSGIGGPKAQEGSALQPSQGISYQALPYRVGNQEDGEVAGEMAWTTCREVHKAPACPPPPPQLWEPGVSSFSIITPLALWASKKPTFHIGAETQERFTIRNWKKNKREAGNQPQVIHFFLSTTFPS